MLVFKNTVSVIFLPNCENRLKRTRDDIHENVPSRCIYTASFKGNPAAVIIREDWLSDSLMQSIALENNLSETAFVKVLDHQNFEIRWFSPISEVAFCGHATLASAFVLFKDYTTAKTLQFHVKI